MDQFTSAIPHIRKSGSSLRSSCTTGFDKDIPSAILKSSIKRRDSTKRLSRMQSKTSMSYCRLGLYEHHQRHLDIAQQLNDKPIQEHALHNLGCVYRKMGQCTRAIECHHNHLDIIQQLHDRSGQGHVVRCLGIIYQEVWMGDEHEQQCAYTLG